MAFLELVLVCSPTVESLVDVFVSAQPEEPPEHALGSPPPEEPPQQVLPHPQVEAPLEDVLAPPQTVESLVPSPAARAFSPSDGGAAGRRACSSSASRVARARASLPSAGEAPETMLARP